MDAAKPVVPNHAAAPLFERGTAVVADVHACFQRAIRAPAHTVAISMISTTPPTSPTVINDSHPNGYPLMLVQVADMGSQFRPNLSNRRVNLDTLVNV